MKLSLLIGMVAIILLSGCKKDEPAPVPATNNFEVLKEYLVNNGMDLPDMLGSWITTADVIYPELSTYHIIDIRNADDFAAGHIPGAVNATLGGILTEAANANGKPIIVACYTGQTAGHAVMAMRLSGYADAKVLKWGMSSWNAATAGSWQNNTGSSAIGNSSWTLPASITPNTTFSVPTLTTSADDGAGILAERVSALLSGGMNKVANSELLASPSSYFVNNYWALDDVNHYGHVAGAYRINPLTLADGEYLNLDASQPVVTYCWTGQTSSMVTAYLKVLGYDSKSLLFGTNGMIYDNLESHKYTDAAIMGYELETSDPVTNGFPVLKQYLIDNSMDVTDVLASGWITTSTDVNEKMTDADAANDYYIIDIRNEADYSTGHIETAVNATLADVLTAAEGADGKTIVIACYTGQTAGHAVMALRLSGYPDAKLMKWGMSSWNAATSASWANNIGNAGTESESWTAAPGAIVENVNYGDPLIDTDLTDGAAILANQVQVLLGGMNKVTNADVLATPTNYFINNFWDVADVEHYGNITGARRVKPLTLAGDEYQFLNPNAAVVSYCWTGQTSSMLTAYLKVLGYDSKSLLFGTNGMIYDNLESHKFSSAETMDFPLVTK